MAQMLILDGTRIGGLCEGHVEQTWLLRFKVALGVGGRFMWFCTPAKCSQEKNLTLSFATFSHILNLWSLLGCPGREGLPFSNQKPCQEIGLRETPDYVAQLMFLLSQNSAYVSDAILFWEGTRFYTGQEDWSLATLQTNDGWPVITTTL